jgi:hypothetical protein
MVRTFQITPVIRCERRMRAGERYLMDIDFAFDAQVTDFGDREEVILRCMLHTDPLLSNQPINGGAVILHRYGGSYGPAQFVLTARRTPGKGAIFIDLINEHGVSISSIVLRDIEILADATLPTGRIVNMVMGEADEATPPEMPLIGLSYARADEVTAARVRNTLTPQNYRVDRLPVEGGGAALDRISRLRALLVVISAGTDRSQTVHADVRNAIDNGVPIIPLVVGAGYDAFNALELGHIQAILDFDPADAAQQARLHDALRYLVRGETSGIKLPAQPHEVYISYSHRDRQIAERLHNDLTAAGIDVFRDIPHILPGMNWEDAIADAIASAALVAALRSPAAAASEFVGRDIALAQANDIPILPVIVAGSPESVLGPDLSRLQALRMDRDYTAALTRLITSARVKRALRQLLPMAANQSMQLTLDAIRAALPDIDRNPAALDEAVDDLARAGVTLIMPESTPPDAAGFPRRDRVLPGAPVYAAPFLNAPLMGHVPDSNAVQTARRANRNAPPDWQEVSESRVGAGWIETAFLNASTRTPVQTKGGSSVASVDTPFVTFRPTLHASPSADAPPIGKVDTGEEVLIAGFDESSQWARLAERTGTVGGDAVRQRWIASHYLEGRPRPPLSASANLNLRAEAGRSARVLRVLQGGTPLGLIRWDDSREWLLVTTPDGEQGFVSAEFVLEPDGISLGEQLRRWSIRAGRTPAVQFVADVTIPDGEHIASGQRFTKVWRVRNTSGQVFAEGTMLAFTGGDPLGARSLTLPINEPLYPEKDADIVLELVAPEKPGRVRSGWELRDRSGQAISLELSVEIEVVLTK